MGDYAFTAVSNKNSILIHQENKLLYKLVLKRADIGRKKNSAQKGLLS